MKFLLTTLLIFGCSAPHDDTYAPSFDDGMGIVIVGDTGLPGPDQTAVAEAMEGFCEENRCDVGLLLGDNFYPAGIHSPKDFETKFEAPYKNLPFKFFAVLGNHDMLGDWKAQIAYESEHWIMPGRWFAFDGLMANFYGLDTNPLLFPKEEKAWLKAELAKAQAPWQIAYAHHPIFSNGDHGDSMLLKMEIKPMLEKAGVDFYLSGHDHNKELIEDHGINYVVCGAGAKHRPITPKKNSVFAKGTIGFCHLQLREKSARLRFLDAKGQTEFEKIYLRK